MQTLMCTFYAIVLILFRIQDNAVDYRCRPIIRFHCVSV